MIDLINYVMEIVERNILYILLVIMWLIVLVVFFNISKYKFDLC